MDITPPTHGVLHALFIKATTSRFDINMLLPTNCSWLIPPPAFARSFSSSTCVKAASNRLTSLLSDPSLLDWTPSLPSGGGDKVGSSFPVYDPADSPPRDGEPIAMVASTGDPGSAIARCHEALPSWRDGTTASHRAGLLTRWSSLIGANLEDLATIMTMESGKPLSESRGEVRYASSFLDYYAAEAVRPTGAGGGFLVPTPFASPPVAASAAAPPRGHILAVQQAVGVAALIAPWNFPMAMITRKVGPALAAGCTAVAKPSDLTPLSAIALKNLADRAGIPPGVFELV